MLSWLTESIPPRPLGLTRILVGVAAASRAVVLCFIVSDLLDPNAVVIPVFSWMPAPTLGLVAPLLAVWMISAILFTIGWRVALSGTVLLLAIVTSLLLDQQTYSNHVYLMAWLVFLLTLAAGGSGISFSRVDRPIVRWPVLLIMIQMSVVYGFSALTKLNGEFLSGGVLAGVLRGGLLEFPEGLRTPGFLSVVATLAVFVELFVALFIWRPRLRPAAFLLGFFLHVGIVAFISPTEDLLIFAIEMLAIYPLFLSTASFIVSAPDRGWEQRVNRYDLFHLFDVSVGETPYLRTSRGDEHLTGFRARTRLLEHSVPWLWIASARRLIEPWIRQDLTDSPEADSLPP